jgi:uncharacterized membrane protein (DUF373 family)
MELDARGPGGWIERRSHAIRSIVTRSLSVGEDLVLIAVAGVLLLAGLVVLLDAIQELANAVTARTIAEGIFSIVENALLALILAELVRTLLVTLGGESLTLEPFIIVAIVAILRKMLLATVLAPKPTETESLVSPLTAELLALGLLILLLGGVLALVRSRRNP